jgi:hypothetical protein
LLRLLLVTLRRFQSKRGYHAGITLIPKATPIPRVDISSGTMPSAVRKTAGPFRCPKTMQRRSGLGHAKKLVVKLAQFPYQSSQMHRVVPGINWFYPPMLWTALNAMDNKR